MHPPPTLTKKQKEIYPYLLTDLSSVQIALELNMSRGAVANQCTIIYQEMGVSSRIEVFAWEMSCVEAEVELLEQRIEELTGSKD